MKRPTALPRWMKRLFSVWNLENVKIVKRVIVSVVGVTVLLIGIALLVLPGPAFIVIPIGLAILATEYAWARQWLKKARRIASGVISGHNARTENR
jgi:uncharacterized protein (TIGR02611 family)